MMENTDKMNYDNLFVDNLDGVAENVVESNNSDDFYDDSVVDNFTPINHFDFNEIETKEEPFLNDNDNVLIENYNEDEYLNDDSVSKIDFENNDTNEFDFDSNKEIENNDINLDNIKNDEIKAEIDNEPSLQAEEEIKESNDIDFKDENATDNQLNTDLEEIDQVNNTEENVILDDEIKTEIDNEPSIQIEEEIKTPVISFSEENNTTNYKEENELSKFPSLTNEEIEQMITEDNKKAEKEQLDDSYVLSNFDVLFDSLYNDVNGANNFISDLIEQKKNVNLNEATLKEQAEKLLRERDEFTKYMEEQREILKSEKEKCKEFVQTQKQRIQNEEAQFMDDMEAAKAERNLLEQSLKIEEQRLKDLSEQFEKEKEIEEQKINTEKQKLETEKEQFEKEKNIELEKIKNSKKELQVQKEQFIKTKELEEKKLELESKNLSQSCARFKELVSQFNSGFQQLPEEK